MAYTAHEARGKSSTPTRRLGEEQIASTIFIPRALRVTEAKGREAHEVPAQKRETHELPFHCGTANVRSSGMLLQEVYLVLPSDHCLVRLAPLLEVPWVPTSATRRTRTDVTANFGMQGTPISGF
jgi:hypothetical protein